MAKARVKDIYRQTSQRYVSGIKGGHGYERSYGGYYNGAGAYCEYPERYLILKVWVFCVKEYAYIDILDDVREATGKQRISSSYINQLCENNVGEVINVYYDEEDDDWYLSDIDDLVL